MWYMGAYLGVGACPGHYSSIHVKKYANCITGLPRNLYMQFLFVSFNVSCIIINNVRHLQDTNLSDCHLIRILYTVAAEMEV